MEKLLTQNTTGNIGVCFFFCNGSPHPASTHILHTQWVNITTMSVLAPPPLPKDLSTTSHDAPWCLFTRAELITSCPRFPSILWCLPQCCDRQDMSDDHVTARTAGHRRITLSQGRALCPIDYPADQSNKVQRGPRTAYHKPRNS